MTRTTLISSILLLATVATTTQAHAAPVWIDGTHHTSSGSCGQGLVPAVETYVGYVDDPAQPLKTGDVNYVHAVANNIGCTGDGVTFEFFLPLGASLAVSAAKPVYCVREKFDGSVAPVPDCLQSPVLGTNGGLVFVVSATTLAPGWYLELQIPVVYNRELLGAAGGLTHSMGAVTVSAWETMVPVRPVTVSYRAQMQNLTSSGITANSANVGLNLLSYYVGGQLSIEYGTTSAFGSSTMPDTVPSNFLNFPNVTANLPSLSPNTTYFWRARFVTTGNGTFTSATQTFTTSVPVYDIPVQLPDVEPCRGRYCTWPR